MSDFLAQLRDRIPFIMAVAATVVWIALLAAYLDRAGGLAAMNTLSPLELATLLAAGTAPLAALWLFMAVLEQRRAVANLTRRLAEMLAQARQSTQQAESQTRALMQLQAQAARAQSAETRQLALRDLASSASVLAERLGVMNREAANAAWLRYGAGDTNVFVQSFLMFASSHPELPERMAEAVARDPVAAAALAAFVRRYERLSASVADDKMAMEIFDDGALGRAFRLFKKADVQAHAPPPPEPRPDDDMRQKLESLSERLEAAAPTV